MEQKELEIAEYVFQEAKKRGPLRPIRVANMNQVILKIYGLGEKHTMGIASAVYDRLSDLGLIEIRSVNASGQSIQPHIHLTQVGTRIKTVQESIAKFEKEGEEIFKKKEQEEEDKKLERQLKRKQLWLAKYWWLTSGASLVVGAIIQKMFKLL